MKTSMNISFSGSTRNAVKSSKQVLLAFAFIFGSISLCAQNITELNGYLVQQKASADPTVVAAAGHLEMILGELQPTVYVGAEITTRDEAPPLRAYVKSPYVAKLSQANSLFSHVELITIRLKKPADLNFVIDLLRLPGFPELKYVYFLCEFECGSDDLEKLFIPNRAITVLYKISLAS